MLRLINLDWKSRGYNFSLCSSTMDFLFLVKCPQTAYIREAETLKWIYSIERISCYLSKSRLRKCNCTLYSAEHAPFGAHTSLWHILYCSRTSLVCSQNPKWCGIRFPSLCHAQCVGGPQWATQNTCSLRILNSTDREYLVALMNCSYKNHHLLQKEYF